MRGHFSSEKLGSSSGRSHDMLVGTNTGGKAGEGEGEGERERRGESRSF